MHKAFLKRKRPLYAKRQEAIADVPDFWLKVVSAGAALVSSPADPGEKSFFLFPSCCEFNTGRVLETQNPRTL